MNILLTGGLGFIGSHTVSVLGNTETNIIIIIDNLYNSTVETYDKILSLVKYPKNIVFVQGDILNIDTLNHVFETYYINAVIHFASLKAVGESIENPILYYDHNINGLISVLKTMKKYKCKKLIFSSSATVYGNESSSPLYENDKIGISISNPYGQTKYFQEQILQDFIKVNPTFEINILRYFNPVGAHPSGVIGEDPLGIPNNLFPYILRVSIGKYPLLSVFGDKYDTPDGSCIRDYIHVMDLAEGHMAALNNIKTGINIYNLGTGKGHSVLEMIRIFEKVNDCTIPYEIIEKRKGDVAITFANVNKVKEELGWEAKKTIEDICKDGYNYINTTY
jgi:UDP-glucose 4-epimerase